VGVVVTVVDITMGQIGLSQWRGGSSQWFKLGGPAPFAPMKLGAPQSNAAAKSGLRSAQFHGSKWSRDMWDCGRTGAGLGLGWTLPLASRRRRIRRRVKGSEYIKVLS